MSPAQRLRSSENPQRRRKIARYHNHRSAVAVPAEAAGVSTMLDFQIRTIANRETNRASWSVARSERPLPPRRSMRGLRGSSDGGGGWNGGEELIFHRSTPLANRDQRATKDDKSLAWDSDCACAENIHASYRTLNGQTGRDAAERNRLECL
ncbi:uncharacterized protein SCHCODRAFT_02308574 [Schizophyllum commune H4-8]|uniref:uncharacterized protein n=1 Tax=Schizophyllum commune (strain H4-8 / FGSC 9210) TaxID=578458 RepID=UPI00215EB4FB|nr:uncharacterized protein SCHCODRAFT_02308574 [Schizophyllum commune H4-8]KAI5891020.1 hypothetical protein SCHCODRAFT_02308574 [Schizophyllum commune H4-8]